MPDQGTTPERVWRAALAITVLTAALCVAADLRNAQRSGAVDLRSRVVGARVWLAGRDPYFHKWQPGMPDTWLDPMDLTGLRVSRVGVTPAVLALHAPFARVPYPLQQIGWLALQWALFLGTLALFASAAGSRERALLIWIAGLLLIAPSHCWRIHVERGQVHILWPFLTAAAYLIWRSRSRSGPFLAGLVMGLVATMRPPVAFFFVPMALCRQRPALAGGAAGVLLGLLLPLAMGRLDIWQSYARGMSVYGDFHIGQVRDPIDLEELRRTRERWPPSIEGESTSLVVRALTVPSVDSSVQDLARRLFAVTLPRTALLALLSLALLAMGCVFLTRTRRPADAAVLFLWGGLFALAAEFFVPAQRYSYNNVTWLPPLCLALAQVDLGALRRTRIHLIPVAGILVMAASAWSEAGLLAGEGSVLLYLVLLARLALATR